MDDNGLVIERIFNAPKDLVWKAWTDPEMVKEWWGPAGFTAPSIKMDVRVGGKYLFAMHGPQGSDWDRDMYTGGEYLEIVPGEKLVTTDYFSDAEGNMINPDKEGQQTEFPKVLTTTILFEEIADGKTKLTIKYPKPESKEQVEAMLKSGMKEGWNSSLDKMARVVEK